MVISNIEADAIQVLKFMASNELVANAKKTAFVIINQRNENSQMCEIKIGNEVIIQVTVLSVTCIHPSMLALESRYNTSQIFA